MKPGRLRGRGRLGLIAIGTCFLVVRGDHPVIAGPPEVTIGAEGVKVRSASSSLTETIDALARAGKLKVSYSGARPSAMLYDLDIESPSISQALFRVLDGQNVDYGVVFDASGQTIASLVILGTPAKAGGGNPAARSQPAAAPLPPVDDDPAVNEEVPATPEPEPEPPPPPAATPARQPPPVSPFAPRPLVVSPCGPRSEPSPSPTSSP